MLYEIEYSRMDDDGTRAEVVSRTQVIDAPAYRVVGSAGGQVRFDDRMLSWVFENGAGWSTATIATYRPLTFKRGQITATAMSSTLAAYNLDNMRRSFASLTAEVTP